MTAGHPREFEGIAYTLIRSPRRKTASILVERDGAVVVRVPDVLPEPAIERLLRCKEEQLRAVLADPPRQPTPHRFEEGELFPLLGAQYPLRLVSGAAEPLEFDGVQFLLRPARGVVALSAARRAFRAFYTALGKAYLPDRVAHFAERMAAAPSAVRVMHLGNRWGSCSLKGAINIHWRAMMAPPEVVDYIVAHEVAHLHEPTHSSVFWRRVAQVIPEHAEHHAWLRDNGAALSL